MQLPAFVRFSSSVLNLSTTSKASPYRLKKEMSKKENALDLAKFVDKSLRVKLAGGREGKWVPTSGFLTANKTTK